MSHHIYKTQKTCSQSIEFDLENGIVKNIKFFNGCSGNLNGISLLAEGRKAEELIKLFEGAPCGQKNTSCPDQLAIALKHALAETK